MRLTITLNRPERLNAFTETMRRGGGATFDEREPGAGDWDVPRGGGGQVSLRMASGRRLAELEAHGARRS